jgi:hypothetical protein
MMISGQRFFAVSPMQPNSTPFIHIRPPGESNRLTIDVDMVGQATLRINDEIAWRGQLSPARTARIQLRGGRQSTTHIDIQHAALYAATQ